MLNPNNSLETVHSTNKNTTPTNISLLDDLGDCCLILDQKIDRVYWCSTAYKKRFQEIAPGSSAASLYQLFAGIEDATDEINQQQDAKVKSVAVYQNQTSIGIELLSLGDHRILIRFNSLFENESEIQRYLQDREQLFLTSRTISVSEMATTLAHEINQPIGTIKNLLHGIKSRIVMHSKNNSKIEPTTIEAIERAIEQTQFAAKIITRIRDYTQAKTPERELLDLSSLVKDCVSLLDWELDHQGIECQIKTPVEAIVVSGDELMLQQVFVNLLRNAIDAMRGLPEPKKMLLISSQQENDRVTISIEDSGCGLSENAEKKLFQPFVSTKPTGMGVGLNICRSFIELHQGKLWLTANEKAGCTSHVVLPMQNKEENYN